MADQLFSIARIAKTRFGFSDAELAEVLGCSRPHITKIVAGDYPEAWSAKQVRALLDYCRLVRDQAIDAVSELEILA